MGGVTSPDVCVSRFHNFIIQDTFSCQSYPEYDNHRLKQLKKER